MSHAPNASAARPPRTRTPSSSIPPLPLPPRAYRAGPPPGPSRCPRPRCSHPSRDRPTPPRLVVGNPGCGVVRCRARSRSRSGPATCVGRESGTPGAEAVLEGLRDAAKDAVRKEIIVLVGQGAPTIASHLRQGISRCARCFPRQQPPARRTAERCVESGTATFPDTHQVFVRGEASTAAGLFGGVAVAVCNASTVGGWIGVGLNAQPGATGGGRTSPWIRCRRRGSWVRHLTPRGTAGHH